MPGSCGRLAFARNTFDVRMVLMPHWSIAAAIDSGPAVKFRLTGTRPAMSAPILASAPPIDDGSISPIIRSDPACFRIQRESISDPTSTRPNVSSVPVASAIASVDQRCFAVCRKRRCSRSPRSILVVIASLASAITACRTSAALLLDGSGGPNVTVTGYGRCSGRFQKNLPRLKLNTLPQTRSRLTGMTGTSRPCTMRSNPRLNGSRLPVRLIAPSAKMQTTWPASSSALALSSDATTSCRLADTGIACMKRSIGLKSGISKNGRQTMNRTKRCTDAPIRKPSTCDRWFDTSSAGPRNGTWSCPTMRMR